MELDFSFFWAWALLFFRMTGLLYALPGIGTEQVPDSFRIMPALILAICAVLGGVKAELPTDMLDGGSMVLIEFALGYIMGFIPILILSGLTVAGQVVSGAIGLGQANMIDASLGESISVLSRVKFQLGILIFLLLDGHLIIFKAASTTTNKLGSTIFKANADLAMLLLQRFANTFELALIISSPIIVASLLTQFVLGLIAKFVPQVNVFLISLPLTIIVGLYLFQSTIRILAVKMESIGDLILNSLGILGLVV